MTTYCGFSVEFYSQVILIILSSLTFRLAVSIWGHSGEGKPPMHGDFEAQRHWMEITTNLPAEKWYVDGPDNDLQYWGLDYPPLTAYHMMLNGKIAKIFNPDIVKLKSSHGIEGTDVKFFMRVTVLAMDLLIFLPAAVFYFMFRQPEKKDEKTILTSVIVLATYPGLALIDNGHFQYNNVSLGLVVLATLALTQSFDLVAAILFCMALNYKQMELYHALPFFAYLLGHCIKLRWIRGFFKLISLGIVVIGTFTVIWSPFLGSLTSAQAVLGRLFPFNRGLYEDKVANFWCSISPIIKFKDIVPPQDMAKICLMVTGTLLLPSFVSLLRHPSIQKFHYASINTSLVFFLFSFHVHEKSILLAAVPACLVVDKDPLVVLWFLLVSVFSMVPLLIKDGLMVPTAVSLIVYWMGTNYFLKGVKHRSHLNSVVHLSLLGCVCLTLASIFIPPPPQLPDLFQLLIAMYSCAHFVLFAIYFHIKQLGGSINSALSTFLNGSKSNKLQMTPQVKTSDSSSEMRATSRKELRKRK